VRDDTMESPWLLEIGIRMGAAWSPAFVGFQAVQIFAVDARTLFLLGVAQHEPALLVDGGHSDVNLKIDQ
jgi:hypothetical protein